jgi:DNA-binding transcriptional MocR family regulator
VLTVIDLTGYQPEWPLEAIKLWRECVVVAVTEEQIWSTPSFRGDQILREVLAEQLGHQLEDLVITPGVRSTISSLGRVGKRAIVEQPTFSEVPHLFHSIGLSTRLVTWENLGRATLTDDTGKSIVWVTSPARNPDSNRLPESALALLKSLSNTGHIVVQNEIYHWYDPTAPRVPGALYVGSLSKLAGGGARLGWVCHPEYFDLAVPELTGATPPGPWQRAWARFIQRGGLDILLYTRVAPTLAARTAFCEEMQKLLGTPPRLPGGPFLALEVLGTWTEEAMAEQLKHTEVLVGLGRDFEFPRPGVRLCFTGITTDQAMDAASRIRRLAEHWSFGLRWVMF